MDDSAADEGRCVWCGTTTPCDCEERRDCLKAGEAGHIMCGKKECGCPLFVGVCEHTTKAVAAAQRQRALDAWSRRVYDTDRDYDEEEFSDE